MCKSASYFIYFFIIGFIAVDIQPSVGQWSKCEGNPNLANSAVWKCVKKTKCVYATNPRNLVVTYGSDEVCCPEPKPRQPTAESRNKTRTPVPQTDAFAKANKVALDMCNEYARYRCDNSTIRCPFIDEAGKPRNNNMEIKTRVLNGGEVELTEYPYMALLGYDDVVTDNGAWDCGGSLICDHFILSAAHCINSSDRLTEVKWAALGIHSRGELTADLIGKNVFPIAERIVHPKYQPAQSYDDIALSKLKSPVEFSLTIRPICLQHQVRLQSTEPVSVTGWGRTFAGSIESDTLLKGTLRYLDSREYAMAYSSRADNSLRRGFNASTMICGGDLSRKNSTCGGDSGGPMQIPMPRKTGMQIQVGITSRGPAYCGSTPTVFTRVSYYLPWMQKIVWPDMAKLI